MSVERLTNTGKIKLDILNGKLPNTEKDKDSEDFLSFEFESLNFDEDVLVESSVTTSVIDNIFDLTLKPITSAEEQALNVHENFDWVAEDFFTSDESEAE